jgi:predicted O-methyltransferase YrrM
MTWQEFVDSVDDSHQMTTSRCHIRLLAELAAEAETVLELGSHAGISTAAMALAAPKATVVSIDLCDTIPQWSRVAYWESLGIRNITPVAGAAGEFLRTAPHVFDLVFHDAVHGDLVVPEYLRCAEIGRVVAIHDFEQLSPANADLVIARFAEHSTTPDERGRLLFVGKK